MKKKGKKNRLVLMSRLQDPLTLVRSAKNKRLLEKMRGNGLDAATVKAIIDETNRFVLLLGESMILARKPFAFIEESLQSKYRQAADAVAEILEAGELPGAKRRKIKRHIRTIEKWGEDIAKVTLADTPDVSGCTPTSREIFGHQAYHLYEYMKKFTQASDRDIYELIAELQQAIHKVEPPLEGKEIKLLCECVYQGFRY